jgi:putative ABC transport system ATP-binding protein
MLEAKNIGYWYDKPENPLFEHVNLEFEPGQMYAVIGSSGSGKTTFLSLLAGLDNPKVGEIEFDGENLSEIGLTNYRRKDVSIVFQAYNLLGYLTAYQNLQSAMAIAGTEVENQREYIVQCLEQVGLNEQQIFKPVTKLSGGQQQRVAIVRAIVTQSDVIVADEPTGNLDTQNAEDVISLFKDIAHAENKIVIIVTHEMKVAEACDVVYELNNKTFTKR